MLEEIKNTKWKPEERAILRKMTSLFGAWLLEKRLGDLYAGGYASNDSRMSDFIRQGIIEISSEFVNEAMALVDVFAPPDVIVNSPLGMADGKVRLRKPFYTNFNCPIELTIKLPIFDMSFDKLGHLFEILSYMKIDCYRFTNIWRRRYWVIRKIWSAQNGGRKCYRPSFKLFLRSQKYSYKLL